jgi:hypothetical protein
MIAIDRDVTALSRADRLEGLRRIIPRHLIRQTLKQCPRRRFCPRLPDWFMVHFVLAMGLFCRDCYRQVFRWLRRWQAGAIPPRSSLCEARKRLGVAPLVKLAQRIVRLLGEASTPGAFYRGMRKAEPPLRLMALDGFAIDVADTPDNQRVFDRPASDKGRSAFPQVRVVALCEAGTHVMWKWLIKPCTWDERPMAEHLLRHLQGDMLLLWDRNFLSHDRVKTIADAGAKLLARISNWPVFQPIQRLSDGSCLAKLYGNPKDRKHDQAGIVVRIIEYTFDDRHRPGHRQKHRLLTLLLDEKLDPALTLIELYHQRWEEELAVDEVKTHEMERPVLRSQTPAGVIQELYALLLDHFIVRTLMVEAAGRQNLDPRRLSFTGAIKILRCRIAQCPTNRSAQRRWYQDLLAEVAEEKLPPRRDRLNPRVIKRKYSKWKVKRAIHYRYPQPTKSFHENVVMLR